MVIASNFGVVIELLQLTASWREVAYVFHSTQRNARREVGYVTNAMNARDVAFESQDPANRTQLSSFQLNS